jgi:hypothetical protein
MKGTLRAVPGCAGELFPAGSETASPVVAAHPAPTGRHAEPGESQSVSRRSVVGTMIAALAPAAGTAVALPTSSGRLPRSPRRLAVDRALRRRRGHPPRATDFSQLRIRYAGGRVFQVRWDDYGPFKVVQYDPGDWERTLRALTGTSPP